MSPPTHPSITAEQGDVKAVHPIPTCNLPKDLQAIFHEIFDDIYEMNCFGDTAAIEAAYGVLCTRVEQEVTAHPVLASTVDENMLHWSLLNTLCEKSYSEESHPVIKFLIQTNPYALLWEYGEAHVSIRTLARNSCHCVLMPWIAEHFAWVLDHESCQERPPHLELVQNYSNGECDALVVRQFYEFYPQGLRQDNQIMGDGMPLHICMKGWEECDPDLIKWMVSQYPDSLSFQAPSGEFTALHLACMSVSMHKTDSMAELCCFLAETCPDSVRMTSYRNELPIHMIARYSNRSSAQKVILYLLRAYPQSFGMHSKRSASFGAAPRAFPFVQSVFPLIEEERSLNAEILFLEDTSAAWCEATECSKDTLHVTVSHIFKTWATLRKATMTQRLEQTIPERITEISREFEAEDVESEDEDEEWDDGEDDDEE